MNVETTNPFTNAKIIGENVSSADYRKNAKRGDPAYVMSRSDLMEFAWCPSRWRAGYDDDGSKATEWGSLMDGLLLDAEHFDERFAVTPKFYPADGKKGEEPSMKLWTFQANYCKEWRNDRKDKEIVKWDDYEEARKAMAVLREDSDIVAILAGSQRQVMVTANYFDEATKLTIPVKGLLDIVPAIKGEFGSMAVDFKTCASAGLRPWAKAVYERGYHVQAALYLDLWNAATGENRSCFGHILQENYAPWQVGKRYLSSDGVGGHGESMAGEMIDFAVDRTGAFISLGRSKYQSALEKYAQCLKSNVWPGYERYHGSIMPGWENVEPELWMVNQL